MLDTKERIPQESRECTSVVYCSSVHELMWNLCWRLWLMSAACLALTNIITKIRCHIMMVISTILCKVVLTFESVDEILKCDHSNESYWAVLSCGTVYFAVQGGSKFWVCGWSPKVWPFKWKLLSSTVYYAVQGGSKFWLYEWSPKVWPFDRKVLRRSRSTFHWYYLSSKVVLTFESVNEVLKCYHSSKSY